MKIVHVLPLIPSVIQEPLTYYTTKDAIQHSLAVVPLRGKSVPAIIVSCEEIIDAKQRLRSSDFSLRRVLSVTAKNFMLPQFIEAAQDTAQYFAGNYGGVISGLVPAHVLEEYMRPKSIFLSSLETVHLPITKETFPQNLQNIEKYAVQSQDDDRFSVYRGIIREEFAKGSSIFLAAPTVQAAEYIHRELSRGIEQYAFLFHGKISEKEIISRWKSALLMKHPALIVATPTFAALPRGDFGTFILEGESHNAYQSFTRPYFDFRYFLESYADKMKARFVFGDPFLRMETLYRYEKKEISSIIPLRFRMLSGLEQYLIDTKKEKIEIPEEGGFHVIGHRIRQKIRETLDDDGNIFLFGVRRGMASLTVCRDCGNVLSCSHCDIPYVLHREGAHNIFICHKCEERKKTEITCSICGSWRLHPLGSGVEQTAEEVRRLFPHIEIVEFHSDTIKSDKRRLEIAERFKNSRQMILIGTEMAIPYVTKASLVAVTSVDSLFSLPDFRIREKTLRKLLEVKLKAEKTFIMQTRYPDERIFRALLQGNLLDFYKDEIEERRRFFYAPFSIVIKISFEGTNAEIAEKGELIEQTFRNFDVKIFPAFIPKIKDKYQVHAVMKVASEKWPLRPLLVRLLSLPPHFRVRVDPENLL